MRPTRSIRRLFYHGKFVRKKERSRSIGLLLLPSVLGIFLCVICICGMTWAWYSISVETPAQNMQAAHYAVEASVAKDGVPLSPDSDGGYTLEAGQIYTIQLRATGTVQECGGYCLISDGTTDYYTQTFKPGTTITIQIQPETTAAYTFTGVWGSLPNGVVDYVADGKSIPDELTPVPTEQNPSEPTEPSTEPPVPTEPTPTEPAPTEPATEPTEPSTVESTYTVQEGDTLVTIADQFGVTTEQLVVYNNIENADAIHSGLVLEIPPADWDWNPA